MRAAVRIDVDGSLASAAVTDSSSMPPKLNMTTHIATQTAPQPLGAKPPSAVRFARPGAGALGRPKNTRNRPTRMNRSTAITLMLESTNSIAPKEPTLVTLMTRMIAAKIRMPTHRSRTGFPAASWGAQYCR